MKAYTDTEQSKKLAKILPLESADMLYNKIHSIQEYGDIPLSLPPAKDTDLPCWSLAALLNVLPKEQHPKLMINAHYKWICDIISPSSFAYKPTAGDNPLDAVFEMILQLYELKML